MKVFQKHDVDDQNGFRSLAPVLIILFLSLAIETQALNAQEIRDHRNILLYRINSDGKIWTSQNRLVAKIGADGRVRSSQNVLLLRIEDDGKVYSASNKLLGRIDRDGWVWTAMNTKMGRVTEEGRILSPQNVLLGKAKGIDRDWVALVWFFMNINSAE